MSSAYLPLRSYLYAPGHREEIVEKAFEAGADAVVFDLEDAVPPAEKERARENVRSALETRRSEGPEAWVRLRSLDAEAWYADVDAAVRPGLYGVRVPKCESVEQLARLDAEIGRHELARGLAPGSIVVSPAIESARGLVDLAELAAGPRVVQMTIGLADLTADLGADPAMPEATLFARSALVVGCRAAGIAPPVVPVHTDLDDEEGLRRSSIEGLRLGFFGRSLIHPKQLAAIHDVFTPAADEVERARELLDEVDESAGAARTSSGRFVDPAILRHARRTIALDERLRGVVPQEKGVAVGRE